MGYKTRGNVKKITLPIDMAEDLKGLTLEQYKEKYGIDLKPYIALRDFEIMCDFDGLVVVNFKSPDYCRLTSYFIPTKIAYTTYEANTNDAMLAFYLDDRDNNYAIGIQLRIPKDRPFEINSIVIEPFSV